MLNKEQLSKLKTDLLAMKVKVGEMVKASGVSHPTFQKVIKGEHYRYDVVEKLIALRDERKALLTKQTRKL